MQFEDGTVEFENLLPIQAAIISLFNDSITYRSS